MLTNHLKDYKEKGFCLVKNLVTRKEAGILKKRVEKNIYNFQRNIKKTRDINYSKDSVNSIHDIDKYDKFFKKFSKKNKIQRIAKFLLQSEPEFRKCEVFAKPAKKGLKSPMHQDNYYWGIKNNNGLTIWIALDKSSKKNGGLTYYEGSHKYGIVDHVDSNAPGSSQKIKNSILKKKLKKNKIITPNLQVGDALIHHCLTFHGSNKNLSNKSRKGFTIQFKDKNSIYDKKLTSHYEKRLKAQLKKRGQN